MKKINSKKQKLWIVLASFVGVIAVLFASFGLYVNDYYKVDAAAVQSYADSKSSIQETELDDGTLVYTNKNKDEKKGLIFYQGERVEYTAYTPLMIACAEKGFTCFLVKMPFNLAFLDKNAAKDIQEDYADIEKWYIGGHALGATVAANYVSENVEDFDGLFLLAGYSTVDLSSSGLKVLSIYGSEDKILKREKYEKYKTNLPVGFTEYADQEGWCYSYFGMYGLQEGDGEPSSSHTPKKQIESTAAKLWLWA